MHFVSGQSWLVKKFDVKVAIVDKGKFMDLFLQLSKLGKILN